MTINKIVMAAVGTLFATSGGAAIVGTEPKCTEQCYAKRWVYFGGNMAKDDILASFEALAPQLKTAGFNGIALNTAGSGAFHMLIDPTRTGDADKLRTNLAKAIATANKNGIEVIPVGGHPTVPAYFRPDMVEAFPTTTPYKVKDGRAKAVSTNLLDDSSFENVAGTSGSWKFDSSVTVDTTQFNSGSKSMLVTGNSPSLSRLYRKVDLKKNSAYRLSFWLKPGPFADASKLRLQIQNYDSNNTAIPLYAWNTPLGHGSTAGAYNTLDNNALFKEQIEKAPNAWKHYNVEFNSGNQAATWFYLSVNGLTPATGKVWIDDVELTEIGLSHPLERNDGADYVVTSADGKLKYSRPAQYDIAGEELVIKDAAMTSDLLVNWRQSPSKMIYGAPAIDCAGNDDYFYDIQRNVYDQIDPIFAGQSGDTRLTRKFFLYYDEIPMLNWEKNRPGCNVAGSAGTYLGRMVRGVQDSLPATVETLTWNDMFDPYMNAREHYFQVNGSLIKKTAKDYNLKDGTVIVNWVGDKSTAATQKRIDSLTYFKDYPQVVALYYEDPNTVDDWIAAIDATKDIAKIDGIMYTTWIYKYSDLNEVARRLRASPVTRSHWPQ